MWKPLISLTGLAFLCYSSSARNINEGRISGQHLGKEQRLRERGSLSHSPGSRKQDYDESELNKLLPYEALENTDVKERPLLPNEIMSQYYSSKKKTRNKNYFTLFDQFNTSRVRREIASERKQTFNRLQGNATTKNGNLLPWEQNLLSDGHNGNMPSVLHFYKAARDDLSSDRHQIADRFAQSIQQSAPRGADDGQGFWSSLFFRNDKRRQFVPDSGLEFPVLRAMTKSRGFPWPLPQSFVSDPTYVYQIKPTKFHFKKAKDCVDSDILQAALERYSNRLKRISDIEGSISSVKPKVILHDLTVSVHGPSSHYPSLKSDESYKLEVNATTGYMESPEVWGIIRGLETFIQMIYKCQNNQLCVNASRIEDFPLYKHRGLLLDTSRHYISPEILKDNLNAMEMNKLNVFHWHIVDDQSFPYVSQVYPQLSGKGAYSQQETYNHSVIRELIEFARLRAIRIIPEFDTPGHSRSWGAGYPDLLTQCGPGGLGPLDPSRNYTYAWLAGLFGEISGLFPDHWLHLGGDECSYRCWSDNRHIRDFMSREGIGSDFSRLEEYYFNRLTTIVKEIYPQTEFIFWQDVLDNKVKVPPNSIIQVWKNWNGKASLALKKAVEFGLRTIVSANWYLDSGGNVRDWDKFYLTDPGQYTTLNEDERKLLIGGEACLWGEYVDNSNILQTLWPRASAVAERLWSAAHVTNVTSAEPRFEEHRCRMQRFGIPASPNSGPGTCFV